MSTKPQSLSNLKPVPLAELTKRSAAHAQAISADDLWPLVDVVIQVINAILEKRHWWHNPYWINGITDRRELLVIEESIDKEDEEILLRAQDILNNLSLNLQDFCRKRDQEEKAPVRWEPDLL